MPNGCRGSLSVLLAVGGVAVRLFLCMMLFFRAVRCSFPHNSSSVRRSFSVQCFLHDALFPCSAMFFSALTMLFLHDAPLRAIFFFAIFIFLCGVLFFTQLFFCTKLFLHTMPCARYCDAFPHDSFFCTMLFLRTMLFCARCSFPCSAMRTILFLYDALSLYTPFGAALLLCDARSVQCFSAQSCTVFRPLQRTFVDALCS